MPVCLTQADFERYDCGELDEATSANVRAHLDSCDTCRMAYARFSKERAAQACPQGTPADHEDPTHTITATPSSPASKVARYLPKIEGYRITGVLGQGGMGIVYNAVQTKLNRTVALKVLPAMVGSANPAAVARFRREATSAARLHHTNIVPIYDFGESRDGYYYAMELVTGSPLNVLIRRFSEQKASVAAPVRLAELLQTISPAGHELPREDDQDGSSGEHAATGTGTSTTGRGHVYYQHVARWMADAADALHYAHGQGIIHRDVKPSNLILSVDGRIFIADFGLAKSSDEESVTITGSLLGTIRYLSPEQAMAKRIPVDHRTDIYSLGATMYELLCFQPAFPGTDDKRVLAAIITRDPTRPRKIAHSVPPELETICLTMLEKAADARYPTGRAVAEDLRRYIHDLPIIKKPPGLIQRARKFVRRHRAAVLAVTAIVLLAVVLTVAVPLLSHARARQEAAELVSDARLFENNRNWAAAAAKYGEALDIDPDYVEAIGNFARMKKEQFNSTPNADPSLLEEGVDLCEHGLAIAPEKTSLWNTMGVLFKKLKRYDEAIIAYQQALEHQGDYSAAWENLGIVQALNRDLREAERNILRAAELAGTEEAECEYPWRNLAAIELHLKRADAIEHLDQALTCNAQDPFTLLLQTRLLLELDGHMDIDRAVDVAGYADYRSEGRNPTVKRVRALAHLRKGDWAQAIEHASEAIRLNDDLMTMDYFIIAMAESELGHSEAARKANQQAMDAWPGDLKDPQAIRVRAPAGVLWIESAEQLIRLRDEAEKRLQAATP